MGKRYVQVHIEVAITRVPEIRSGGSTAPKWAALLQEKPGISFNLGQSPSLESHSELGIGTHK